MAIILKENLNIPEEHSAAVFNLLADLNQGISPTLAPHITPTDQRLHVYDIDSDFYIGVFIYPGNGSEDIFLLGFSGTYDAAQEFARTQSAQINPVSGIVEIIPVVQKTTKQETQLATKHDIPETESSVIQKAEEKARKSFSGIRLVAEGHTVESLYTELGLNKIITSQVLKTTTSIAFYDAIKNAPTWQREAFTALAAGQSIETIKEDLGLTTTPDPTLSEEEQLRRSLQLPASQMQFSYTQDDESLRAAIESSDFNKWRTYLHPSQRKQAESYYKGSARIFGGAGTGKTVVAVHRAFNLYMGRLNSSQPTYNRVILTTYTNKLAASLSMMIRQLDSNGTVNIVEKIGEEGLYIQNIDRIANDIINLGASRHYSKAWERLLGYPSTNKPTAIFRKNEEQLLEEIIEEIDDKIPDTFPPALLRTDFLIQEWIHVFLGNNVRTKADYLRAPRTGRRRSIARAERIILWEIFDLFRKKMVINKKVSWETLNSFAAELVAVLKEDGRIPENSLADHIVVDEAQDFHPGHWRLIRALTLPGDNDIFISEDSHQRIYGNPIRLSHFNINIRGRSRGLKLNYRTTEENLDFATNILEGARYSSSEGTEDGRSGYFSLRSGPEPVLEICKSKKDEIHTAATYIKKWLATEGPRTSVNIGILVRENRIMNYVITELEKYDILAKEVKNITREEKAIPVMTMHSAKGLEFSHVIIFNAGDLPYYVKIDDEDSMRMERSLMYVATSRARDELLLTSTPANEKNLKILLN